MTAPRLLDLFCGAGGCSAGYARAGFDVVGVDLQVQPAYPYFDIVQANALDVLADLGYLAEFDAIHASPPCQQYSTAMKHLARPRSGHRMPMLLEPVRELLVSSGKPYIIENVPGAPLLEPVQVCGTGLGLRIQRHRLFESNVPLVGIACAHVGEELNPHNQAGRDAIYAEFGGGDPEVHWRAAMGVDWMGRYEAREAIPPAYTEHLGRQLLAAI